MDKKKKKSFIGGYSLFNKKSKEQSDSNSDGVSRQNSMVSNKSFTQSTHHILRLIEKNSLIILQLGV